MQKFQFHSDITFTEQIHFENSLKKHRHMPDFTQVQHKLNGDEQFNVLWFNIFAVLIGFD